MNGHWLKTVVKNDLIHYIEMRMATDKLNIYERPQLTDPRLVLGFSGWMDGGEVSTGTVQCLIDKLGAKKFAEIDPEGFYIYNFPGMMEVTSMFRPYTKIKDGLIRFCDTPSNEFFCDAEDNLILFLGKEPNMLWDTYAKCIFSFCDEFDIKKIYFIGSVAGLVPHTREPRLFCTVSDTELKDTFQHYGVTFANYEGPASIVTYLTVSCGRLDSKMVSLIASVPAYVQGRNHKCIESMTRRLAGMLGLKLDLNDIELRSDDFQKKLDEIVQDQPELETNIRKLEEDYDNEIFNSEMGELKRWLEQQGIRID